MNRLTDLLHIDCPIIQGGMGNISHAQLTASISEAGGLGTFGVGTFPADHVRMELARIKELTDRPFCVNIPIRVQPDVKEMIRLVLDLKVPVVSLSAGNPKPIIPILKEAGVTVMVVTASVKQAVKAEEAGADIIVAEGYEAAGINSNDETTTMTLIPQIADAVSVPVAAAGGIGDGRGVAAALCLGAEGVQMGTRFIATKEALVHEAYKKKLLESSDVDTIIVGRSVGKIRRLVKTPYAALLAEVEKEGTTLEEFDTIADEASHIRGALEGKLAEGHINGGQIAGLIRDVPTVKELLNLMMEQYRTVIEGLNQNVKR
ncbi:NAD(P)H-dependent flavin oxidoreductase [Alteribacter keqinensis]|uniref:Probable nitronate monooxygenase n=1 Tax=Alteribacter keqinensis TaxID=2483800 RepID=A0A3M7TZ95_9BACI|nr:nitronate monooxygenase [Alteribacter keqinensis]RNA69755.1 2-nitropropane dioxygenase [Alteribacter keqinensis]